MKLRKHIYWQKQGFRKHFDYVFYALDQFILLWYLNLIFGLISWTPWFHQTWNWKFQKYTKTNKKLHCLIIKFYIKCQKMEQYRIYISSNNWQLHLNFGFTLFVNYILEQLSKNDIIIAILNSHLMDEFRIWNVPSRENNI